MFYERDQHSVRALAVELYDTKRPYLLAVARRNGAGEADAEEALQEAFAAFIEHFDPLGGAPPVAWLTLTLKRECWARSKRARGEQLVAPQAERGEEGPSFALELMPSGASATEDLIAERDRARRALARLKADERSALGLKAAGLSYEEIGERRGWTYTKVNRCLAEGRATLREGAGS